MRFKNTSKVIIFSFIYLSIISPPLLRPMALAAEDAQAYNNQATQSTNQEPACPYQNPPQEKPEIYYSMPPKTIDKGRISLQVLVFCK